MGAGVGGAARRTGNAARLENTVNLAEDRQRMRQVVDGDRADDSIERFVGIHGQVRLRVEIVDVVIVESLIQPQFLTIHSNRTHPGKRAVALVLTVPFGKV